MNVDNKSDKKKTTGNKSVKHKDEKETSTDNTNITTNDESDSVDDVYNIESLVEKKGSIYLVKWENYPEDQNTWESKCSIPDCVREVNNSFLNFVFFCCFSFMNQTFQDWESQFHQI